MHYNFISQRVCSGALQNDVVVEDY